MIEWAYVLLWIFQLIKKTPENGAEGFVVIPLAQLSTA